MHLPAIDDGGPHQPIEPGTTWSPSWTIIQPAATLWYHPHPMGQTADQTYRGIAGLFIIDDETSKGLSLPHRYGVDDIPLVIQDKNFNSDGSLNFADHSGLGRLGNTFLVNGTYKPHLSIGDQRVRFRLLNASDSRVYNLGFSDNRTFEMIATDGGLVEHPVVLQRIQLAPAERAEIVVTFRAGESATLHSFPPDLGLEKLLQLGNTGGGTPAVSPGTTGAGVSGAAPAGGSAGAGVGGAPPVGGGANGPTPGLTSASLKGINGAGQSFDLLHIKAEPTLRRSPAVPEQLATLPPLDVAAAVRTRQFVLESDDRINGQMMDMNRVNFSVYPAGAAEIWEVLGFLPPRLPYPRRQLQSHRYRGCITAARTPRLERRRLHAARHPYPPARSLQQIHRPQPSLHVPLSHHAARRRRDDGPIRRHQLRPAILSQRRQNGVLNPPRGQSQRRHAPGPISKPSSPSPTPGKE